MNPQTNTSTTTTSREAALTGLAIVGFIALVGAGMYLAVYSSRYVPSAVSRIGAAAVSLSSVFKNNNGSSLTVIPNDASSTTISFGDGATTTTPYPAPATATTPVQSVAPTAGQQTSNTIQMSGGTIAPAQYSGLPDLAVSIIAAGYLTTSDTASFVASSTVPAGMRPAVQFTVKNIGTNVAGPWHFSASIPTQSTFVYQSANQQALNPGDSIDYTLGFDQPKPGLQPITVSVNYDNMISESNTTNNNATINILINQ